MKLNNMSARRGMAAVLGAMLAGTLSPVPRAVADEGQVDRVTRAALKLDADPKRGAETFGQVCAHCHGAKAHGNATRAIPALAGQRFAYLVRQLANFAGGERDSATMHRIVSEPRLRDPQAWVDVAAYLNALPVAPFEVTGDGSGAALGRGIFHEQCSSCHRADAHGDDAGFVPALRNQHYSYLVSQMHKLASGARHNADEDLVRFIRSLEDSDIAAVADYLSRLRGPGADRKHMRDDGVVVD
ncbi:MAG: c-type cytochrome [Steroidobacterales bacterium]